MNPTPVTKPRKKVWRFEFGGLLPVGDEELREQYKKEYHPQTNLVTFQKIKDEWTSLASEGKVAVPKKFAMDVIQGLDRDAELLAEKLLGETHDFDELAITFWGYLREDEKRGEGFALEKAPDHAGESRWAGLLLNGAVAWTIECASSIWGNVPLRQLQLDSKLEGVSEADVIQVRRIFGEIPLCTVLDRNSSHSGFISHSDRKLSLCRHRWRSQPQSQPDGKQLRNRSE